MSRKKRETLTKELRLELWLQCDRLKFFLAERGKDIGNCWRGLTMTFNDRAIDARIFCGNVFEDFMDNRVADALRNLFRKKSGAASSSGPIELSPGVTLFPPERKL